MTTGLLGTSVYLRTGSQGSAFEGEPNISKHLRVLQETGWLKRRQVGNTVYYAIGDAQVFALCDLVCSGLAERLAAQAKALPEARPARRPAKEKALPG